MKRNLLRFVLGVAIILGGCVPSLHSLYTDKDLIFDPGLVGLWSENKETWLFEKDGDNAYRLTYTDGENKKGVFQAHLLKLGDLKFIDLYPDRAGLEESGRNDLYLMHYIPTHTFLKVLQISPTLRMAVMRPDWLDELLKADPKAIAHEREKDGVLLTASTKDLQAFVLKHAATDAAWGDPTSLQRAPSKPDSKPANVPGSGLP